MSKSANILIVDDEPSIRTLLKVSLEGNGYHCYLAENGKSALTVVFKSNPDLVILDLGLPDFTGLDVLKQIRLQSQVPVLILTVKDDEQKKVELLDHGADDYLTKPFGLPELLARVRVALRHSRARSEDAPPVFISESLRVDLVRRQVKVSDQIVKLTATEYELLRVLVLNAGKVMPQGQLLAAVWGVNALEQSHYLRIYIAQLRKKLEETPSQPKHILTESGIGYRLV